MVAAIVATVADPADAEAALLQTWPAFALVMGLLLIGVVAADDGLFMSAGAWLGDLPGGAILLFCASMAVATCVTVVLNLDTAVVFLTPVLLHAARRRRLDDAAFALGAVFMCNAASLLLPGSNLTNLIVLAEEHVRGAAFAAALAPGWVAAVVVTAAIVGLAHRRDLRGGSIGARERIPRPGVFGLVPVVAAAALVVGLHDPALPVLILGVFAAVATMARRRLIAADVLAAANPAVLLGLLGLAVGLGTLARTWSGPAHLLAGANRWETAAIAAVASIAVNNLPAAVLLSATPPAHARALLLGLNIGPNLAITGSLSAILWLQVSRREGFRPSAARYSRLGLLAAPAAIAIALLVSTWWAPRGF